MKNTHNDTVSFSERTLHQVLASIKRVISREQLERFGAQGLELIADEAGRDLVLTLTKTVLTDRLLSKNVEVEAWIDVPWEANVLIERPRSFGDRLLRRAPRRDWVAVSGRIRQRGTVLVQLEHRAEFPESRYVWPEVLGRPRRVSTVIAREDPRWTGREMTSDVPLVYETGGLATST